VLTLRTWLSELLAALFLGAVGAFFLRAALALPPPDEAGVPGAGTVPAILGGFIILGALVLAISALRRNRGDRIEIGSSKPLFALASLIIGALIFEPAGFLLSTFIFLTVGFTVLGEADWRKAAPAAALFATLLWLFFTKLLGVGLPYGLIGEVLFR
jgi:putative tricarboxylic transport membrane protein